MKKRLLRLRVWMSCVVAGLTLAGCAVHSNDAARSDESHTLPLLRLTPDSLGRNLAEQQLLTFSGPGIRPANIDVMLEVDTDSVRMAFLGMGRVMARMRWDGTALETTHAQGWPESVSQERILSDLQMALWPLSVIQEALPAPWEIVMTGHARRLREDGRDRIVFTETGPGHMEIDYLQSGWRLTIQSQPATGAVQ